jgi:hypothetical protein
LAEANRKRGIDAEAKEALTETYFELTGKDIDHMHKFD